MNIEEEAKQNIQTMKHQVADFCKTMGFDFHIVHDSGEVETLNGNQFDDEEEYDEEEEARAYEGGLEDYLYDNYVAEQLDSEDK